MEWRGQGGCKIGFPNSDLKYSPRSAVVDGSIESIHESLFYSKHPKIEPLRSPRCDGLDPLVQDSNQAKNMPQNYFTKPTMWLLLRVQVGVHCHPKDMQNTAYKIQGRYQKSNSFIPYSETPRNWKFSRKKQGTEREQCVDPKWRIINELASFLLNISMLTIIVNGTPFVRFL